MFLGIWILIANYDKGDKHGNKTKEQIMNKHYIRLDGQTIIKVTRIGGFGIFKVHDIASYILSLEKR